MGAKTSVYIRFGNSKSLLKLFNGPGINAFISGA